MKSIFKKTYSKILMVLVLALAFFTVVVNADTPAKLSFTKIDGDLSRGDTVTVKINLSGAKDFNVLDYELLYDKEAFKFKKSNFLIGKIPEEKSEQFVKTSNNKASEGKVKFAAGYSEMEDYLDLNGEIATVEFEVLNTATGKKNFTLVKKNFARTTNFDPTEYEYYDLDVDSMDVNVLVPVNDITVSSTELNMIKGDTEKLEVSVDPIDTSIAKDASFTSSSESVATVDSDGNVKAVGVGDAEVTVNAYGKTKKVTVHVTNPITSVDISDSSITVEKGKTKSLTATVKPDDTSDSKDITWSSNNPSIATVDNSGVVTGVSAGHTTIKATASNGVYVECIVDVVIPIKSVTMDDDPITLNRGQNHTLDFSYTPADTTDDTTITWTSSNQKVATVNNGVVTAVSGGTTTITASMLDGKFTKSVEVTVEVKINDISLSDTSVELLPGQEKNINVVFDPSDANDKSLTWKSNDTNVVTVSNGKITAVNAGTTTVTVTANGASGPITKTINVKVLKAIDGITILPNADITLNKGAKETLGVKFTPEDAEQDKTITWSSSNPSVASVDSTTGEVTALKGGKAVITGALKNSELKVTANITVEVAVDKVTLNKSEITINKNDTYDSLKATVSPDDATDKTVTWSSSNDSIATVDTNGHITAVSDGEAVITATADSKSAQVIVHVITPVTGISINEGSSKELNRGETLKLTTTINPTDATDKTVTWKTSNSKVVSVDNNGNITAVSAGEADITVVANGSSKEGTVTSKIHVKVIVPVTEFKLPDTETVMSILRGGKNSTYLHPIIGPSDATADQKVITWESTDPSIVSVTNDGKLTGLKVGNTTVRGTLSNGLTVTSVVTVSIIPLTDIEVIVPDTINRGKEYSVNVNPLPANTTEFENVTYESDNTDIFGITSDGKIIGKKAGTATLKVTVGSVVKEIEITVIEIPLEAITSLPEKAILNIGETTGIITNLNPYDATDDITYTYKSSDEDIATVDSSGKITAVGAGKVKITVTANDEFSSEFELNVVSDAKNVVSPKTYVSGYKNYLIIALISIMSISGLLVLRRKVRG